MSLTLNIFLIFSIVISNSLGDGAMEVNFTSRVVLTLPFMVSQKNIINLSPLLYFVTFD